MKKYLFDIRVHIFAVIIVIISEAIGIIPISFGPIQFSLLPMLYALLIGVLIAKWKTSGLTEEMIDITSKYVGYSVMSLIAFMASSIGPNLDAVVSAGPALILQEFGNLATVSLSVPIAVYLLKMDRTTIGSAFSTSRESSIAIVGNLYGLDGPEGQGVMGAYITGTLFGTILNSILASLMINISWFRPEALAMAAGTGSSSMMSAAIAPIVQGFPDQAQELNAFAATSQVLTAATGLYMSIFIAIPLTEWLYSLFKGRKRAKEEKEALDKNRKIKSSSNDDETEGNGFDWFNKSRIWFYAGLFSLIAMWIASIKEGATTGILVFVPGILWLTGIVIVGNVIDYFAQKINVNLPTILYIALLSSLASIPQLWSGATYFNEAMSHISLLPLTTPILAYAGISIARELENFKQQGVKIVVVAILALMGTFIGSAIVSNIVLNIMG